MTTDEVTIVIAAKDEVATIGDVVQACRAIAVRVLVVDGHSRDGTADAARRAGAEVLLDHGRGKGDAIRTAAAAVDTPITVFIDADGSHDPADIPKLIAPIVEGGADHVTGSRLRGGSSELHGGFDEFCRLAGSSFITACINRRFGVRLSDSQNGFRAIRTSVLKALPLRSNKTTIEQEMIMLTLRLGYRMDEVPAHEYSRRAGQSHIQVWRDAPWYVVSLVRDLFF
jgi:dolichol-phosphate mannosyltransferase